MYVQDHISSGMYTGKTGETCHIQNPQSGLVSRNTDMEQACGLTPKTRGNHGSVVQTAKDKLRSVSLLQQGQVCSC